MQQVAMSWLVYRMTGSPLILGIVGFASQIPAFLFGPFAGVLADRLDRRRTIMLTQFLSMVQAFLLALLTLTGTVQVWHVIALGIFLGCVNSLDIPVRHSFILEMVERKEVLGNAIALNSLMFNVARLIGPSIAGILVALMGEGVCFEINGFSFLAVLFSLSLIRTGRRITPPAKDILTELLEGVRYAFGFAPIREILLLLSAMSLMGASYIVLMPVFAREVFGGGPDTLGFLMAAVGVGALCGTLFLASRKRVLKLGRTIPVSAALFGTGMILFSFSRSFATSVCFLALSGAGFMVNMAASNTVIQTIVDDDKRGRVMSFYSMAFMGMAPIGSLLVGSMAHWIGAERTIAFGGGVCLAVAGIFASRLSHLKKKAHPHYERLGIKN
jgi:MFS family permease